MDVRVRAAGARHRDDTRTAEPTGDRDRPDVREDSGVALADLELAVPGRLAPDGGQDATHVCGRGGRVPIEKKEGGRRGRKPRRPSSTAGSRRNARPVPVHRVAIRRPRAQDEPAVELELDKGSPPGMGLNIGREVTPRGATRQNTQVGGSSSSRCGIFSLPCTRSSGATAARTGTRLFSDDGIT